MPFQHLAFMLTSHSDFPQAALFLRIFSQLYLQGKWLTVLVVFISYSSLLRLCLTGFIPILNVGGCQVLFPLDIEYSSASFVILVYWPWVPFIYPYHRRSKVFTSPAVKENLARCSNLGWQLSSFRILSTSFHSLLAWRSSEQSAISLVYLPLISLDVSLLHGITASA